MTTNTTAMANMFNDYAALDHDEKEFVVGLANYDLAAENAAIKKAKKEAKAESNREFVREHPVATAVMVAGGVVAATALGVVVVATVKAAIEHNSDGSCCDSAATAEGFVEAVI